MEYVNVIIYIYNIYIVCDPACNICTGSGNENCESCNTISSYYPLHTTPTTCLFLCNSSSTPLYLDSGSTNTCKPCHAHCLECFGGSDVECSKCLPPYYLGNNQECIYTECALNYPNTFPTIDYVCEQCHHSCNGCIGSYDFCLSCAMPYFALSQTNFCLAACPAKYYSYTSIRQCQCIYIYIYIVCPDYCEQCERINFSSPYDLSSSNFKCLSCESNYFLNITNNCITETECGIDYYPERANMTCSLCNIACIGCTGPDNFGCILCIQKYFSTPHGTCELILCNKDQYFDHNTLNCQCNIKINIYIYI